MFKVMTTDCIEKNPDLLSKSLENATSFFYAVTSCLNPGQRLIISIYWSMKFTEVIFLSNYYYLFYRPSYE